MREKGSINRRTALRALAGGGSALALSACGANIPSPTPTATARPTQPPTPAPTSTDVPITPTPDLSHEWTTAEGYFEIEERVGRTTIEGNDYLIAIVGGHQHAVSVKKNDAWMPNIPYPPTESTEDEAQDVRAAQIELAAMGYGIETHLVLTGSGKEGLIAIPGDSLYFDDCYGATYAQPVENDETSIRWMGEAWVVGTEDDGRWEPAIPAFIDGTDDVLDGMFIVTVDDCHYEEPLIQILDVLDELEVKATFFPNTPNVKLFPTSMVRMAEAGHEIGYHTTLHSKGEWDPPYLSRDRAYFESVVQTIIGNPYYRLKTVRPPFGLWDQGGWMDDTRAAGLTTVMWGRSVSEDAYDWSIDAALADFNSHILLAHARDTDAYWFETTVDYLRGLKKRFTYATATEALLRDAVKQEIVGIQV